MINLKILQNVVRIIHFKNTPQIVSRNIFQLRSFHSTFENNILKTSYPSINFVRNYAKSKDKKKDKKKGNVQIQENQLREVFDLDAYQRDLQRAVDHLQNDLKNHVSLRSSAGALENIKVETEEQTFKLQEIAQISRKSPKMVVINAAIFPQYITDIMKALQQSGMNLNPQQQGTTIYIPIQAVTTQYREELIKSANVFFNKFKDNIRDVKNKYVKKLKNKSISEDERRSSQEQITAIADTFTVKGKDILSLKQKELAE